MDFGVFRMREVEAERSPCAEEDGEDTGPENVESASTIWLVDPSCYQYSPIGGEYRGWTELGT